MVADSALNADLKRKTNSKQQKNYILTGRFLFAQYKYEAVYIDEPVFKLGGHLNQQFSAGDGLTCGQNEFRCRSTGRLSITITRPQDEMV